MIVVLVFRPTASPALFLAYSLIFLPKPRLYKVIIKKFAADFKKKIVKSLSCFASHIYKLDGP